MLSYRRLLQYASATLLATFVCCSPSNLCRAQESFDWSVWRTLSVRHGGRSKPLDTLAREVLRNWSNRGSLVDPQTGERLEPTAAYVTLLLEWQGWEHPERRHLELSAEWKSLYFPLHTADRWDELPLLRVEDPTLRAALSVKLAGNLIAPQQLFNAQIKDYRQNREIPFPAWAERTAMREGSGEELVEFEQAGLQLAQRLWSYQNHRMARGLEILPQTAEESKAWTPLAQLLLAHFDDQNDPTGQHRAIKSAFSAAGRALRNRDAAAFNRESRQLVTAVRELGHASGAYADERLIALEAAYNRCSPFRIAWGLMLLSTLTWLLRAGTGIRRLDVVSLGTYLAGVAVMVAGFAVRCLIAGRPPVTNMYETVVYVGAGVAILGLAFAWVERRTIFMTAAAVIATLTLILADSAPLILDPGLRPLEPVLRSNFWLLTHVLTITLSYAALALALGLGNVSLGYSLVRSGNEAAVAALGRFIYRVLQFGVLMLAVGIMLGGVWADYSWGRFWGWDPKEVWALVALLGYLAVLHARYVEWVGDRGLAALAVVCFALIVMAWYGVNFVLGVGLHAYGFGAGGQRIVYLAVVAQLLFVVIAMLRAPDADQQQILGST